MYRINIYVKTSTLYLPSLTFIIYLHISFLTSALEDVVVVSNVQSICHIFPVTPAHSIILSRCSVKMC